MNPVTIGEATLYLGLTRSQRHRLRESLLDVPDVQDESGILTYYTREQVIEHMEAAVLAADQASRQAGGAS